MDARRKSIDLLYSAKRYADAEAMLCQLVQECPNDSWAFCKLARVHIKTGEIEKAISAAKRGIATAPSDAATHRVLAWSLHFGGSSDEACQAAEEALRLAPGDPENFNTFAWTLAKAGRSSDSLAIASRGLSIDPQHAGLWNVKARALLDLQRWREAISVLHGALKIECDKFFTYAALGACHYSLKEYDDARVFLESALSINPHSPTAQVLYKEIKFLQKPSGRLLRIFFPKKVPLP